MITASRFLQNSTALKSINRVRQDHKCTSLNNVYSADGKEIDNHYTLNITCKAVRNDYEWASKTWIIVVYF